MKNSIIQTLQHIEANEQCSILLACETGSRAWGFPSPDSDYDVRVIYSKNINWHLSIDSGKDSYQRMKGDLDITGWELKKVLRLIHKSNMAVAERLQSPIMYHQEPAVVQELRRLSNMYFSPKRGFYHYQSMARNYIEECNASGKAVKLKKYFYALRASICATWIVKTGKIPDIKMDSMFSMLSADLITKIEELIEYKSGKNETFYTERLLWLDSFLTETFQLNAAEAGALKDAEICDDGYLNEFFYNLLVS